LRNFNTERHFAKPSMNADMTAEHGYRLMPAPFAVECDGLATDAL
jgi:hypothetical protein